MAITLRNTKGSALTYSELDANFTTLETAASDAQDAADDAQTDATQALTDAATANTAIAALKATVYNAPTTGATVSPAAGTRTLILKPAGTILALTVALPPTPADSQKFTLTTTQIITGLTLTHAGTIQAALTAGIADGFATWQYRTADTTWYRIG